MTTLKKTSCKVCWFCVNEKCCHAIAMENESEHCHYYVIKTENRPSISSQLRAIPVKNP